MQKTRNDNYQCYINEHQNNNHEHLKYNVGCKHQSGVPSVESASWFLERWKWEKPGTKSAKWGLYLFCKCYFYSCTPQPVV